MRGGAVVGIDIRPMHRGGAVVGIDIIAADWRAPWVD
jgi:hypothetical protein